MNKLNEYKKFNILYVEDDSIIRINVEKCLGHIFNVISATDGKEGLLSFLSNDIDLIITDLKMPNKNGLIMLKDIEKIS